MRSLKNAAQKQINNMNVTRIIILGFVISMSACNSADKKTDVPGTDTIATMKMATDSNVITAAIDSSHTAQNSLDWQGIYKGVLPCADCEGIETEIMLHADSSYMISTKYLGKKDKAAIKGDGKFIWVDGFHIQLQGIKNAPSTYFVSENRITQMDMAGKKIEGASAEKYVLNKQVNK